MAAKGVGMLEADPAALAVVFVFFLVRTVGLRWLVHFGPHEEAPAHCSWVPVDGRAYCQAARGRAAALAAAKGPVGQVGELITSAAVVLQVFTLGFEKLLHHITHALKKRKKLGMLAAVNNFTSGTVFLTCWPCRGRGGGVHFHGSNPADGSCAGVCWCLALTCILACMGITSMRTFLLQCSMP